MEEDQEIKPGLDSDLPFSYVSFYKERGVESFNTLQIRLPFPPEVV